MYTVKDGKLFWEAETTSTQIEKPAFMWDADQNLLLKHGESKKVQEYYDTYVSRMSKLLPDVVQTVHVMELNAPAKVSAAFLNEAISTTGVIDRQIAKLKDRLTEIER